MNSDINRFPDRVDEWKLKVHEKLKRKSPRQREAFWQQIRDQARARGLNIVEPAKKARTKRVRRPT